MTIIRLFGARRALRSQREAVFRVGLDVILPRALGADAVVVELDPAGELNEADDPVIVRIRRVIARERNDSSRRACQILREAILLRDQSRECRSRRFSRRASRVR